VLADPLGTALEQWKARIGPENVVTAEAERAGAETATFATSQRIPAILRPAGSQQVSECLTVASDCGIPVYPISSGKNWGYGSRVPPGDGCALLDLSRMNRIIDFNEKLAYVTVEPGVTQRQLFSFLEQQRSRLWMDATGSSPDCSLIGNIMERGFGHTPYGEHFAHICGMEVVLPNGEVLETGSARHAGSATAAVNRWGLGPSLDGLFSQSNLGVVTRLTIWLMPAPDEFAAFFFRCESETGLSALIDALRELRLRSSLHSSIHIANDYKVLGGLRQYPWKETGGQTPLMPKLMAAFREDLTFGFWNASGGLYGTAAQVAESKKLLRAALSRVPGKLKFVDERMLRTAKRFAKPFRLLTGWDIARTAELVEPVIGLMKGIPTAQSLSSVYWRKRIPVPAVPDPDRDRCGLLWYAPVAPADGEQVDRLIRLVSKTLLEAGFEPLISLTLITPRTVNCVISITYDRDVEGEDQRAMKCYHALANQCTAGGYHPYRLGITSMQNENPAGTHARFVQNIRAFADPASILAPGRYER
jgi:4-cresol dehydrogenase (hydroxylating) flavoprotein subunit